MVGRPLTGPLNYDGAYALLWGSQIADGHRPEVQLPLAPTPKPLLIAFAMLLDGLGVGHRAETILLVLSVCSLGWLAGAAGAAAWRLAGWPAAAHCRGDHPHARAGHLVRRCAAIRRCCSAPCS